MRAKFFVQMLAGQWVSQAVPLQCLLENVPQTGVWYPGQQLQVGLVHADQTPTYSFSAGYTLILHEMPLESAQSLPCLQVWGRGLTAAPGHLARHKGET